MKTLYLFAARIKQYYTRSKVIFILFLVGGILNAITLAFCYGNMLPSILNRNSSDLSYREYFVKIDEYGKLTEQTLQNFMDHPLVRACSMQDNFDTGRTTAVLGDYPLTLIDGTLEFTGPYQMLVPLTSGLNIGDTVTYRKHEFEVIGIVTMPSSPPHQIIPYETYTALARSLEDMDYFNFFSAELQVWGEDKVLDWIKEALPFAHETVSPALYYLYHDAMVTDFYFPIIAITAFLGVFTFTVLLYSMVKLAAKENIISIILGASKARVAVWSFAEALVLGVGSNIVGFLLHWVLYRPVFQPLNLAAHLSYSFEDYCLLCFIILVFSLITTIPVLFKQLFLSPIAARRSCM